MNIYLITSKTTVDWDQYDSAIVIAKSITDAKKIHPDGRSDTELTKHSDTWVSSTRLVQATLIGIAKPGSKRGVVLASFNAG